MSFHHVDAREAALMKSLHADGYGVEKVAKLAKRSTGTASNHVFKKNHRRVARRNGRPATITEPVLKCMLRVYEKLLKGAHPGDVAAAMLKGKAGLSCSEQTTSRADWAHGILFKPLYGKPQPSARGPWHNDWSGPRPAYTGLQPSGTTLSMR